MKSGVVGLHIEKNGSIILRLRKHDLQVRFGKPNDIARKFQNFKAFYKKTKQDNLINQYELVDLQFGNQVVATKK
jgi:cell division protein FtsQ